MSRNRRGYVVSSISLALCAVTLVMRVGGYSWSIPIYRFNDLGDITVGDSRGAVFVVRRDMVRLAPGLRMLRPLATNPPQPAHGGSIAGFRLSLETHPFNRDLTFEIPPWAIILATGSVPVLVLLRYRSSATDGVFCTVCGYDLRATPDRCPECGSLGEPKTADRWPGDSLPRPCSRSLRCPQKAGVPVWRSR